MKVYIDDMLVKNMNAEDHIKHLRENFRILRKYRMKLNSLKFTFGIVLENSWATWTSRLTSLASQPSIDEAMPQNVMVINESSKWMKEIIAYLTDQGLPDNKDEV
ncbi:Reverse transcriptase domain-containing protein [Abeliophyllum distichum]|uniref:Reverse transcriptase domain-containing protein n=1 Tax=Abeliophyllum distichum TaxID=126358 RepID=A0ABD1QHB9_9LAMI